MFRLELWRMTNYLTASNFPNLPKWDVNNEIHADVKYRTRHHVTTEDHECGTNGMSRVWQFTLFLITCCILYR